MSAPSLSEPRAAIIREFTELAAAEFRLFTAGFDSIAVDVGDRLIFKFPRHAEAEARLRTEVRLLAVVRPAITMQVPELTLHEGPPLFSRHEKLKGEHLLAEQYGGLNEDAKRRLAGEMARFFAELHALDATMIKQAGAGPIGTWLPPQEILRQAWPLLPPELRLYAERTIKAWADAPPDPGDVTFGFFDSHGWNMAFDHASQRLNGIYDFGDAGFGPLHHEFIQPNWISRDLTGRIIGEYERLTGRNLDRERIDLLTGVLRLSELGGFANEPERVSAAVQVVADWATATNAHN